MTQKNKDNLSVLASFVLLMILAIVGFFAINAGKANANPSDFPPASFCTGCTSASSSAQFASFGVGTSTTILDAYQNGVRATKAEKAIVFFQFVATSTSPIQLNAIVEYSMDGVDYYPASNALAANATTTPLTGTFSQLQFSLATSSSAIAYGGSTVITTATSTITQSFIIDTPARYTRIRIFPNASGIRGTIWTEVQPQKERPE